MRASHRRTEHDKSRLNARRLKEQQAREAVKARELHLLKIAAAAVASMEEAVKKRIDAELEAMALEDRRSREVRLAPPPPDIRALVCVLQFRFSRQEPTLVDFQAGRCALFGLTAVK